MSIASSLFTDSQARIFPWLFGQPGRIYHLSELRRLTGLGSASLQRELNRLSGAGLIHSERFGNLRQFKANRQSLVFEELHGLIQKTMGAQPLLRDALLPLESRLRGAWIFGSVAKQTDSAHSDIDVMIVGENILLSEVLERLIPLEARLCRKVNPSCYTSAEFERRRNEPDSFVNRVLAQPVLPLFGNAHEPGGTR
jgi:predicted nucleotidyltransferase